MRIINELEKNLSTSKEQIETIREIGKDHHGKGVVFDAIQLGTNDYEVGTSLQTGAGGLVEIDEPIYFKLADASMIGLGDYTKFDGVLFKVSFIEVAEIRYTHSDGSNGLEESILKSHVLRLENREGDTVTYFIPPDNDGNLIGITKAEILATGEEDSIPINAVNQDQKVSLATGTSDIISGTDGNDVINAAYTGDPEGDMVDAGDNVAGNNDDVILAGNGNDLIVSDEGDDIVYGGNGNDEIYAQAGNDILYGENGRDLIFGVQGNDIIDGGAGNDYLSGGYDDDILTGGQGADVFVFDGNFDSDIVTDFTGSDGDRLEFIFYTPEKETWDGGDILSFILVDGDDLVINIPDFDEEVRLVGVDAINLSAAMIDISFLG